GSGNFPGLASLQPEAPMEIPVNNGRKARKRLNSDLLPDRKRRRGEAHHLPPARPTSRRRHTVVTNARTTRDRKGVTMDINEHLWDSVALYLKSTWIRLLCAQTHRPNRGPMRKDRVNRQIDGLESVGGAIRFRVDSRAIPRAPYSVRHVGRAGRALKS